MSLEKTANCRIPPCGDFCNDHNTKIEIFLLNTKLGYLKVNSKLKTKK